MHIVHRIMRKLTSRASLPPAHVFPRTTTGRSSPTTWRRPLAGAVAFDFSQAGVVVAVPRHARYRAAFVRAPHPIAGLAHDGIAAIGASLASGRRNAVNPAARSRSSDFAGGTGTFRLMPDGTNGRGLAVLQIGDGRVVIVDPAPRGFTGAGF